MAISDHVMLDAADRRILAEVQRDMRRSPDVLAEATGLSPSSFRRRLKRLRQSGVIRSEVALIDPVAAGIEIIVMISMNEEHSADYDRLKQLFRKSPEVTQSYSVTGEVDMVLHVVMPNMERFEAWLQRHILQEKIVRRCTSHVVYSRIKFETALPV